LICEFGAKNVSVFDSSGGVVDEFEQLGFLFLAAARRLLEGFAGEVWLIMSTQMLEAVHCF
jgi:hypothetical protein